MYSKQICEKQASKQIVLLIKLICINISENVNKFALNKNIFDVHLYSLLRKPSLCIFYKSTAIYKHIYIMLNITCSVT